MQATIVNTSTVDYNNLPPFVRKHYGVLKNLETNKTIVTVELKTGKTMQGDYFYYDITTNLGVILTGVQPKFIKEI
jgi:hypothetical protein